MQIDMHFYGTYALARAAGLPPNVSKTIATAAQFVDDAIEDVPAFQDDGAFHVPVPSCHPLDSVMNLRPVDQWHVWLPYHFLPGNRGGSAKERLICRRGDEANTSANGIIELALRNIRQPFGAHLLGVMTHVLQDTFSHAGFMGIGSRYNNVVQESIDIGSITDPELLQAKQSLINAVAVMLKAPGHAAVDCLPDYPYLNWSFEYEYGNEECPRLEDSMSLQRSNPLEFAAACKRLHAVFCLAGSQGPAAWNYQGPNIPYRDIEERVRSILSLEASREGRSAAWIDALRLGKFCDPEVEDYDIGYDELAWRAHGDGTSTRRPEQDSVLFMRASHTYRHYVHSELLPALLPGA